MTQNQLLAHNLLGTNHQIIELIEQYSDRVICQNSIKQRHATFPYDIQSIMVTHEINNDHTYIIH